MRLSTRQHGLIDYVGGLLLILIPVLSGLDVRGAAALALILAGVGLVVTAAMTDFEAGVIRIIQIPLHLWVDGIIGLLLALSPWLFVFYTTVWWPHVLLGAVIIGIAFLTQTVPGYDRRRSDASGG